ncbi:lisH domain-containing protein ARMC9-like isoform X3 [Corticium candelabrum]|uniref:lisH domain-containing protein ARMC9-like isoform X3 n=1 Tax=Corticium candelabrum TaxID=121492 RepID=UPI002E26897B|nr:lisH domain-containing protein ARMC9-like isoform X3 [Corticium candelabrum]
MEDWEREAIRIVLEYLSQNAFVSANAVRDECRQRGQLIDGAELGSQQRDREIGFLMNDFLSSFEAGDSERFFELWKTHVPADVIGRDATCAQLEFRAHLSFAVHPLKRGLGPQSNEFQKSISDFKSVVTSCGSVYGHIQDFVDYAALAFVPDPTILPNFKALISPSWDGEFRARLEHFLKSVVRSSSRPQLYYLIMGNGNSVLSTTQVSALRQHLQELECKMLDYQRRVVRLQSDNQIVVSVAVELVDALEEAVKGRPVTAEHLQDLVGRIYGSSVQQSVDMGRPETASALLRASLHEANLSNTRKREVALLPSLDYKKIKADWKTLEERPKALLCQALRWRLTKSIPGEQRDSVITAYIQNDLLGTQDDTSHQDVVLSSLRSRSTLIREHTAFLFNTFSSLSAGRTYLCQCSRLISVLHEVLVKEESDTAVRQNVLGTLQKLSLRQKLQTEMIREGIIDWLVTVLQDQESLSNYSLHYTTALLMNLCLRTSGKLQCIRIAGKTLKCLSDLLEHEDVEVRSYVNGALYSILAVPQIREEARAMGMEEILQGLMQSSEADLSSQLEYIIKQLRNEQPCDESSDDEGDDDDEEEDAESLDVDLDESLAVLSPRHGELTGDRLLYERYLWFMTSSTERKPRQQLEPVKDYIPLQRPVTPKMHGEPSSGAGGTSQLASSNVVVRCDVPDRDQISTGPKTRSSRQNSRPTSGQEQRPASSNSSRPGSRESHLTRNTKSSKGGTSQLASSNVVVPCDVPDRYQISTRPKTRSSRQNSRPTSGREQRPASSNSSRPGSREKHLTRNTKSSKAADETSSVSSAAPVDVQASILLSEAIGEDATVVAAESNPKPLQGQGTSVDEYMAAFATRPKIPRSPSGFQSDQQLPRSRSVPNESESALSALSYEEDVSQRRSRADDPIFAIRSSSSSPSRPVRARTGNSSGPSSRQSRSKSGTSTRSRRKEVN